MFPTDLTKFSGVHNDGRMAAALADRADDA
jgi:hypothetical protein